MTRTDFAGRLASLSARRGQVSSIPRGPRATPAGTPWALHGDAARRMFQCQLCGVMSPPRTRPVRVIVQRRSKKYPYRLKANLFYRTDDKRKRRKHETDDPGGMGWEIVQELLACPACAGVPAE